MMRTRRFSAKYETYLRYLSTTTLGSAAVGFLPTIEESFLHAPFRHNFKE